MTSLISFYVPGLNLCPQDWQTFIGVPLPKNPHTKEYPLLTVAIEDEPHLGHLGPLEIVRLLTFASILVFAVIPLLQFGQIIAVLGKQKFFSICEKYFLSKEYILLQLPHSILMVVSF